MEVAVAGTVDEEGNLGFLPNGENFVVINAAAVTPDSVGEQKTLVVMMNFSNTTQPPLTKATVDDVVFNQTDSFYRENSYNQTFITGESFGWLNVPHTTTCYMTTATQYAFEAVPSDVDLTQYGRLIIVAPFGGCGIAAVSTFGKTLMNSPDGAVNLSIALINYPNMGPGTIGHEFGHGLGVDHANFYNCGSASWASSGCSSVEYGDWYDAMGTGYTVHMNAGHKDYLGWLDANRMPTVTTNGQFTIEPIESDTAGLKAIRIPRGSYDYLYVEYRQPLGYDANNMPAGTDVFEGALLHTSQFKTLLLDATPPGDKYTPALLVGQTFTDPITQSTVRLVSKTAGSIVVDVQVGRTDFIGPTVAVTSPLNGASVADLVAITADASDESGISKVDFYVSGQMIGTDVEAPYSVSWDSKLFLNGSHNIVATAYDRAGEPWGQSNNLQSSSAVAVNLTNVDLVPPAVEFASITSPTYNPVHLEAVASDDVGVYSVEFYADGALLSTDTTQPYSFDVRLAPGTHQIIATAKDYVGNSSSTAPLALEVLRTTVSITNPQNLAQVSGIVPITVQISDLSPWAVVKVLIDGNMFRNIMAQNGIASVDWDARLFASNSLHQITAMVIEPDDTVTDTISVTIKDQTNPVTSVTAPVAGSLVVSPVTIQSSASDDVAVSRVEFYVDDVLVSTQITPPYSYTSALAIGAHTVFTKAYDAVENVGTSAEVSFTVKDAIVPTVQVTNPTNGSTVPRNSTVTIQATASDNIGVAKV
ncbi:MAG: Ig-like domain-containing protein [bacterium]|nr:Ig-like domain-containing protein [bacterium]